MKRLIGVSLMVFFSGIAFTQSWKKADTITKKEGVFVFPLLYYTPDTRFAAGAVGVYYFNTGDTLSQEGKNTRLSYVKMLADYTQNRQLDVWSSWNVFTNKEKYLFKGEVRFRNFPDRFYGIGNTSLKEHEEFYSYDLMKFKLLALRQFRKRFFIGLDYQFSYEYNFTHQLGGELISGTIEGYNGGIGSGIGGVVTYDTRDNVVNAYSGMLFEVSSYVFDERLGGNFNFSTVNLTFNKYWELKENHILALNAVSVLNFGRIPFLDMAKVGNDDILRGYASNRFRDNHFAGLQLEYRFPVWRRFGMVVFTGVGDVFRTANDIKMSSLKYSFGSGIRYAINTKERLNVRLDYGIGRSSDAFYIMLTEAF